MVEQTAALNLPSTEELAQLIATGIATNLGTPKELRPYPTGQEIPGGLVLLKPEKPVVIVPDIHARPQFLDAIMAAEFAELNGSLRNALAHDNAFMICSEIYRIPKVLRLRHDGSMHMKS